MIAFFSKPVSWGRIVAFLGMILVLSAAAGVGALYYIFAQGLPSVTDLKHYAPPLPSRLRDVHGTPVYSFGREDRILLSYDDFPPLALQAFLSAEDKTFFSHGGLDYPGILSAMFHNVFSSGRPVGASTITQQVAKNLLLNNELSYSRKGREAILAHRIEQNFTKERILELYLNQIFFGRGAYGIEAASRAYFDKSLSDLTLPEFAFLAILPKAPSRYNPVSPARRDLSRARRDWVLGQMMRNGYISDDQHRAAIAAPLGVTMPAENVATPTGAYFFEEARRQLLAQLDPDEARSSKMVYEGGLWVRLSIDMDMQRAAERAMRDALIHFDRTKGWRGPLARIDVGSGWAKGLRRQKLVLGHPAWVGAVILAREKDAKAWRLGFADGSEGLLHDTEAALRAADNPARRAATLFKPGDIIPVEAVKGKKGQWSLRQIPEVSGGLVVQDPHTGRILAMVGGFDARLSQFNRATQARRQAGSTFKPFVYATALDNGYTPASLVEDSPYCVLQGEGLEEKCFRNFSDTYKGWVTLRSGLEQSRNLVTIRLAKEVGMEKIVANAKAWGLGDYPPYLSVALGAGETSVLNLASAFSMLSNGGKRVDATFIDLVQDRTGHVLLRADDRSCPGCRDMTWTGQTMPQIADQRPQVMDARTAYQVVHILEGVVKRGTAASLRSLNRPLFGKTGTTNGPTDVWFVGGTRDITAAVYIGYDQPRALGRNAQGGRVAGPVVKQFIKTALADTPKAPFPVAPGVYMLPIERATGRRAWGNFPAMPSTPGQKIIWEAFKKKDWDEVAASDPESPKKPVQTDRDFLYETGGIY